MEEIIIQEKRVHKVSVALTPSEKEELQRGAEEHNLTLSNYIRYKLGYGLSCTDQYSYK